MTLWRNMPYVEKIKNPYFKGKNINTFVTITSIFLFRILIVVSDQLSAPFDLLCEIPNLSTVKLIKDGRNPYDPNIYSNAPFIITIYTPFYHYIVSNLPMLDRCIEPQLFDIIMFPKNFFVIRQSKDPLNLAIITILNHYQLRNIGSDYYYYIRKAIHINIL